MSNKKIYSYIERKMIEPSNYRSDYNIKQKSSLTVGDLLKKVIFIIIIIFIGFHLFPYLKTSSPEYTKSFLDSVSNVSADSNTIIKKIVTQYNSNNFSDSYKQELQNDIQNLQHYSFEKDSKQKFNDLRENSSNIIKRTQ